MTPWGEVSFGDVLTIVTVLIGWIAAVIRMDKRLAILEEIVKRHDRWIDDRERTRGRS